MDSSRLAGPRTFGVASGQRSQSLRPIPRDNDRSNELSNRPGVGSLDHLPTSIHTVPITMAVPNTNQSNVVMPGRLEQTNSNAFSMIFRKKYERLDWRKLAAIDLEKIYKTQDTRTLQENLTQMAFFDLEEELRSVDIKPQFSKLFQLMQLCVEYLLYVQDHLQHELDNARAIYSSSIRQQEHDVKRLVEEADTLRCSLQASRDELRKRKKVMIAQQEIINSAARGNYHRCPLCEKAFIERGFLETHFRKRHPNGDWSLLGGSSLPISNTLLPVVQGNSVLDAARDRIRELETLITNSPQQPPIVIPPCPAFPPAAPYPVLPTTSSHNPEVPTQILELYHRQSQDLEALRRTLGEIQNRYSDSEKALLELRKDYERLSGKVQHTESAFESPREVAEVFERRVNKLQETFETRLGKSEDSWKDRFLEAAELHKRDLKDVEREMTQRANEQQMSHKAEKLQLQMDNEELLKRIRDLESQLNRPQPRPRKDPGFQVQVHTNRSGTATSKGPNRWGPNMTPRVTAAMSSHPSLVNELRDELADALNKKLEEYGIPPGSTKVSDSQKDRVFERLREEHGRLQGKLAKFSAARSTIENHMKNRLPAQYSSSDLLDEASKIRVRTRIGRQVTETGPGGAQRVTEVTTYDIRPARPSELDLAPTHEPDHRDEPPRPKTAPGSRRVTFEREPEPEVPPDLSRTAHSPHSHDLDSESSAENFLNFDRPVTVPRQSVTAVSTAAGSKKDDGAWFTDESD